MAATLRVAGNVAASLRDADGLLERYEQINERDSPTLKKKCAADPERGGRDRRHTRVGEGGGRN
jgi:hypothetical protein